MLVAAAAALAMPMPAPDSVTRWRSYTAAAAVRCGVPIAWIERVMRAESAGQTMLGGRPITSPAGAMGLMQLMPATWREMRAALDLGRDPHGPRDNIVAGACYLRQMYDRFGYPGLFAAYNAGPERYAEHLATRRPLPPETRTYLATLVGGTSGPASVSGPSRETIFFALGARSTTAASSASSRALFVTLGQDMARR